MTSRAAAVTKRKGGVMSSSQHTVDTPPTSRELASRESDGCAFVCTGIRGTTR
jgi:hypothetical protein